MESSALKSLFVLKEIPKIISCPRTKHGHMRFLRSIKRRLSVPCNIILFAGTLFLQAAEFHITGARVLPGGNLAIDYESFSPARFVLFSGQSLTEITNPIANEFGTNGTSTFVVPEPVGAQSVFFRIVSEPVFLGPVRKLVPSRPRKKSVVPLWQSGVLQKVEFIHLLVRDLHVRWVTPGV